MAIEAGEFTTVEPKMKLVAAPLLDENESVLVEVEHQRLITGKYTYDEACLYRYIDDSRKEWEVFSAPYSLSEAIRAGGISRLNEQISKICAIVHVTNRGKFLMSQRSDIMSHSGTWELAAGGAVNGDEHGHIMLGGLREAFEEIGLHSIKRKEFCGIYHVSEKGLHKDIILIHVEVSNFTPVIDQKEVSNVKWVNSLQGIGPLSPITPMVVPFFKAE